MENKIIFFDIDGTLLNTEKKIPQTTKASIEELKKNGVHVVIATGRPPFMFEQIREELEIDSYVSFNGQHVVYKGETIYKKPMKKHEIIHLHEDTLQSKIPMVYFSESEMRATVGEHQYIKEGLGKLKFYYPEKDEHFPLNESIYQALMFCEKGKEDSLIQKHASFSFLRWHTYSIDILPVGGTKAIGIEHMMKASGLNHADSYAFGDGLNDLEMLQAVGTGVAMGNARDSLKTIADFVTDSSDNDGIFKGLKQLKLI